MTVRPLVHALIFLVTGLAAMDVCAQDAVSESLRVTVGGDVMAGRYVGGTLRVHGGSDPFSAIGPILSDADVALVNLETPIADHHPRRILRQGDRNTSSVILRMPTTSGRLLAQHGVDGVALANNHIEDADAQGIQSTADFLDFVGIEYAGAHPASDPREVRRFQRAGHWVALFSVTTFRNRGEPRSGENLRVAYMPCFAVLDQYPPRIASHRAQHPADLIVASIHWGGEMQTEERGAQRRLAKRLVDAGADLIWGHHPHVLQPAESYRDAMILYSTGNLVFDMRDPVSRRSGLFQLQFDRKPQGGYLVRQMTIQGLMLQGQKAGPRLAREGECDDVFAPLLGRGAKRTGMSYRRVGTTLVWERPAR